ncbi:MAG: GNAT family N-acetyltransferase [Patescibacteria group bacterium]
MIASEIDLRGVQFDVIDPTQPTVSPDLWESCHAVGLVAFRQALRGRRTEEEIRAFFGDLAGFTDDHRDPQTMVEQGRLNLQRISRPSLAVAYSGTKKYKNIIGFAYSADSVTAETEIERGLKYVTLLNRWRWVEKIAVDPNFQRRGVGRMLAYLSLRQARPLQPASAYTHPAESAGGARFFTRIGMPDDSGDGQPIHPYHNNVEVEQRRHKHRSARRVAANIATNSDDPRLFKQMGRQFGTIGRLLGKAELIRCLIILRMTIDS